MRTRNRLRWTTNGQRRICTSPTGLVGWYQPTGYCWGVFTPGRAGWNEQLTNTEPEARELLTRHANP